MVRLRALIPSAAVLLLAAACSDAAAPPTSTPAPRLESNRPVDAATLNMKVLFEYRGWFSCPGDESGLDAWLHWFDDASSDAERASVHYWPDVSDLEPRERCPTAMSLHDGGPAYAFSSANPNTVSRHFQWMEEYGLDGVFLHRPVTDTKSREKLAFHDRVAQNVKEGAEAHGRVFAVMYDLDANGADSLDHLGSDWAYLVDEMNITDSDQYLHHDGRPVVGISGLGPGRNGAGPEEIRNLVERLHSTAPETQLASLLAVAPVDWRTEPDPEWADAYRAFDFISPQAVGEYEDETGADDFMARFLTPDVDEAASIGVGYVPTVWPGLSVGGRSALNSVPRDGGRFYWRQVHNAVASGAAALRVATFDDMYLGTAMFKLAPTAGGLPAGGGFLPLNVDGYDLPSDWYLRLGGETGRLLRREIPLSPDMPIAPRRLPDAERNRIEMYFISTSEWATVDISTPGNVMTVRVVETRGEPMNAAASVDRLILGQSLAAANSGNSVDIEVEYTVDLQALRSPMELRLEKGAFGRSALRVVKLTPQGARVLRHVSLGDTDAPGLTVVIDRVGE